MWDFSIGSTLGIMLRTWPFILLRLVVYFVITLVFVLVAGAGAGIGYGVGHISTDPAGPESFALGGGFLGVALVALTVFLIREYLLYLLKAGHIAVMVHLIEGRSVPFGESQIGYAQSVVKARFLEANVLFAVDQLIKGAVAAITTLLGGFAAVLPVPGLQGIVGFLNTVIRIALTYVDEVVLGFMLRGGRENSFDMAARGVVLYAQNGMLMLKNALWLAVIMWVLAIAVFVFCLAPAAAILYVMPGQLAGWSFVLALVMAWAIKAALIEPFVIAALMSVYFRAIEGQSPDPQWESRLSEASAQFRDLKRKAGEAFGGRPHPTV